MLGCRDVSFDTSFDEAYKIGMLGMFVRYKDSLSLKNVMDNLESSSLSVNKKSWKRLDWASNINILLTRLFLPS
jgi:hypothetical protein